VFPLKDNIPVRRTPVITIALIAINVIAYLISLRHGGSVLTGPADTEVVHYGAIPYAFTHLGQHCGLLNPVNLPPDVTASPGVVVCQTGAHQGIANGQLVQFSGQLQTQAPTVLTAFTSMFLHANILHIAGNMLFLWVFGPNVEDVTGRVRYLAFYLLGGLAALGGQILVGPNSTAPTLGASGAIAAVLGGYILLYPGARVLTLVFIIFFVTVVELPALLLLGFWFLLQVAYGAAGLVNPTGGGGGVAYFAHVGGFLFGLLLIRLFARRRKPVGPRYPVY
jgi:membrane associated rhomboid family serine protease